jgi:hypothetical protein
MGGCVLLGAGKGEAGTEGSGGWVGDAEVGGVGSDDGREWAGGRGLEGSVGALDD